VIKISNKNNVKLANDLNNVIKLYGSEDEKEIKLVKCLNNVIDVFGLRDIKVDYYDKHKCPRCESRLWDFDKEVQCSNKDCLQSFYKEDFENYEKEDLLSLQERQGIAKIMKNEGDYNPNFENTGYILDISGGESYIIVCYGCYEEKITFLRDEQDITSEDPIFLGDEYESIPVCEVCNDEIGVTLIEGCKD